MLSQKKSYFFRFFNFCTNLLYKKKAFLFLTLFFILSEVEGENRNEHLIQKALVEGITVDLREPTYSDGVLRTEKGGVITGPNLRIQARKFIYTRKVVNEKSVCCLYAEGDLMIEIGDNIFVGDVLNYDFQERSGMLERGRTSAKGWFLGGERIEFLPDDTFSVHQAYITTTESGVSDWIVETEQVELSAEEVLVAHNVTFKLADFTIFWIPKLTLDLNNMGKSPFSYRVGWAGKQGPRVGMIYEFFSYEGLNAFARLDYRLTRGLGAGIETHYHSADYRHTLDTFSYFARDSSVFHPSEHYRYRFLGGYHYEFPNHNTTIDLVYDKLSDKYMATDYADQGIELEVDGKTQLEIRNQNKNWISQFFARPRINSFETLKQDLPTIQLNRRPYTLGSTGIIGQSGIKASYLNFAYANRVICAHDFNSMRLELTNFFYRPTPLGPLNFLPEIGSEIIYYSNNPEKESSNVVIGSIGTDANLPFFKFYDSYKHVMMPYLQYRFFTYPTATPKEHYIFDINDGWYRLNVMRFGLNQSFYGKSQEDYLTRWLYLNIYADAFFHTPTIPNSIPKVYGTLICNVTPRVRYQFNLSWNFYRREVDHTNFRAQWTFNPDSALSIEFLHRDAYDWRKVDRDNFMLDAFRSVNELRHSTLSDRRSTLLLHWFFRFHPNWAIEYESRHGYRHHNRTTYSEFEIDLSATLRSASQIKISYQRREIDDRIVLYFSVGLEAPEKPLPRDFIPLIPL